MAKKNILVFPCGSEIGLEIFKSLQHSTHFNLIGGSSVNDHGRFVYTNYIGNIPFATHKTFVPAIKKIVAEHKIDAIYPAMDSVIDLLKQNESLLGCKIVASPSHTTSICLSKTKTYNTLKEIISTPKVYSQADESYNFPLFLKPDIGYGSRGAKKVNNITELREHLKSSPENIIISEYLPGNEYTVDCFTDSNGELLFVGPRKRARISNGISVNTSTLKAENKFTAIANKINASITLRGAWFFQVKENAQNELVLMEIASRLAGSSSVYRQKGINFAAMSLYNCFDIPVSVFVNHFDVELDRALDNKYKINITYQHIYIDYDDTIIVDNTINIEMIKAVYHFINLKKKIYLITKHDFDIYDSLKKYRLINLFDEVIHLKKDQQKSDFIKHKDSIFIDDSFAERKAVFENLNIPVFSVDTVSCLL